MHCRLQISQDSWSWRGPRDRPAQQAHVKTAARPRCRRGGWQAEAALLRRAMDAAGKCGRTVGRGWHSHSSPRTKTVYPGLGKGLGSSRAGQSAVGVFVLSGICLTTAGWLFGSFPPGPFRSHTALLRYCQPLPVLPQKRGRAVLPSPPLTLASPRHRAWDAAGGETWGWAVTERPSE